MEDRNSAKGRRYTQEQIVAVLREVEAGEAVASVGRRHGVNVQTLYRWRERYAGMTRSELAELKDLHAENRRLRHVVAELSLDVAALKELQTDKW